MRIKKLITICVGFDGRGMTSHKTRRSFLKATGTVLGTFAVGSTITAAQPVEDRELIDMETVSEGEAEQIKEAGDVIHALDEIDVWVVEVAEENLPSNIRARPDLRFRLELPIESEQPVPESDENEDDAPEEPFYGFQWDKQDQEIPAVHELSRGEGTRVTIIDSGVAANHPDMQHAVNADLSKNFTGDQYGAPGPFGGFHGTHVAGIVAANDRNEEGVLGTAPATEIVDCRVFSPAPGDGQPSATVGDVLAAMVYSALIDADAANLSFGAYPLPLDDPEVRLIRDLYARAATFAKEQGTLMVAAAGNEEANLDTDGDVISLPNEAENVMSISATGPIGFLWDDEEDVEEPLNDLRAPPSEPAFYTNYGPDAIDVSAPGGNADLDAIDSDENWFFDLVFNTFAEPSFSEDGEFLGAEYGYAWVAGTSMAAPQVTATAALLRDVDSDLQSTQVHNIIEQTAEDLDSTFHGEGYLAVNDAVEAADETEQEADEENQTQRRLPSVSAVSGN